MPMLVLNVGEMSLSFLMHICVFEYMFFMMLNIFPVTPILLNLKSNASRQTVSNALEK